MARITLIFGSVLIALGLIGYLATDRASITALIPAFFGAALLVCGVLASKEHLRKHVMHLAVLIGLVGLVVPAYRSFPKLPALLSGERIVVTASDGAQKDITVAVWMQVVMAVICAVFVGLCIKSFVDARRSRAAAERAAQS